jgi:outer membrane immunogenic protein
MKRLFLSSVALFALAAAAPASAADLPARTYTKAPAALVAVYNWTGGYIGINGGYAWGTTNWSDATGSGSWRTSGGLIGGTLGYNVQAGQLVYGLEGDLDWTRIRGTASTTVCTPDCATGNSWLGTVRGRLGMAWDRTLGYVTGGVAFGNIRGEFTGSESTTKAGWTLGAGAEFALTGPWTAKVEYLYVDLGKFSCSVATCGGPGTTDVSFKANILRAGLNYRF